MEQHTDNDSKGSVTKWDELLRSDVPAEREEAERKIVQAFDRKLLGLIKKKLGSDLQRRLDPEDVTNSAYRSFLELARNGSGFANRNAMFACLRKIALHKVYNQRRYHTARKRDIREEEHGSDDSADAKHGRDGLFHKGKKPVPQAYLNPSTSTSFAPVDEQNPDGFLERDALLRLMAQGASPDHAAVIMEVPSILRKHDKEKGDCLERIFELSLAGRRPQEIAKELDISRRTLERKRNTLEKLLW